MNAVAQGNIASLSCLPLLRKEGLGEVEFDGCHYR